MNCAPSRSDENRTAMPPEAVLSEPQLDTADGVVLTPERRSPTPTRPRRRSGSTRSTPSSSRPARSGHSTCSPACRWRPTATASAPRPGINTPYINTIPAERPAALPRQPRDGAATSRAWSAGTRWRWSSGPTRRRHHRRPHLHLRLVGHPLRSRLQPLLPRPRRPDGGDQVYFQGHASPGIYARAFLEGRLEPRRSWRTSARNWPPAAACRRYPHPWLMPDFWQFPTVSMGLGPIMAIYQARFNRYLEQPRPQGDYRPARLVLHRRRRDATSRKRSAP